ncbi:hypothetical protein ABT071_13765 [Streptomyces sp. NPDC002506]|uniref:hypothetical protein n=1 Tax=Streptomyces sp. NPDC002506 TaxID=3154536 RepID=UPI003323BE38
MMANRVGAAPPTRLYASTTDTSDGDLDLIAIEQALNGEPARLTLPEKIYAARLLDQRGLSLVTIGQRIGSAPATVRAWKANDWRPGGPRTRAPARDDPVCGERRAYRRHLKNGERCDVCRAANAAADRRYRLTGSQRPREQSS